MTNDELQALLDELRTTYGAPAATAAVLRGGELIAAASGTAHLGSGVAATTDTLFQIGSITKIYTTTLVMTLVDEGLVRLDDPVVKHVPQLADAAEDFSAITVRHLLNHTSGIDGDYIRFACDQGDDTLTAYVDELAEQPLFAPAGALFSYCNSGFVLAGRLVEAVTGQSYAHALRQRVLAPAGLDQTVVTPYEAIMHPVAVGHVPDMTAGGQLKVANAWTLSQSAAPAGSMPAATASDLARFFQLHLDGGVAADGTRIISEAQALAMQTPTVALPPHIPHGDSMGLGWFIGDYCSEDGTPSRYLNHGGATLGQTAMAYAFPEHDLVLTAIVNGGMGAQMLLMEFVKRVVAQETGLQPPPNVEIPAEPPTVDLASFAGVYGSAGSEVTVSLGDGGEGLTMHMVPVGAMAKHAADMPAMPPLPIVPISDDEFAVVAPVPGPTFTVSFLQVDGQRYLTFGGRAAKYLRP